MGDFVGGIILGAVVFGGLVYDWSTESYNKQLTECQKDLPRSQNCVLIAVPQLILDAKEGK